MMRLTVVGAIACLLSAASVSAKEAEMVSAADPQGMAKVLARAGYEPELGADSSADPKISLEFGGREGRIFFYGCDEASHDGCDAVQFSVGFDRENPWTADEAIKLSTRFRFAALSLDDEGDPFVSWDVITGDGIPAKVFLRSVLEFTNAVVSCERVIFEDDDSE